VLLVTAAVAAVVALAGGVALATRGVVVATAVAALVLVFRARAPRPRTVAVTALCIALLAAGAIVLRAIRDYSQSEPLADTPATLARTSPLRLVSPDLIEFDHLVGLEGVVPEHLDWLDGESLAKVPAVFVPRALWPDKPLPLDLRVSEQLTGARSKAGYPFTLPGEMWWNLRFGGSLVALLALGLIAGRFWRFLLVRGGAAGELVAAVITGYTYLLLTRPLGPMLLTAATAAVATLVVHLAATLRLDPVALRNRLGRELGRLRASLG
jgi:hypothetical protein